MLMSVDRLENGHAICISDDRRVHVIPLSRVLLPVREGDCIFYDRRAKQYRVDHEQTEGRRQEMIRLLKEVTKPQIPE